MKKVILFKIINFLCFVSFLYPIPKVKHGFTTAITNNGQRVLYSNELLLNNQITINSNFGFHNETSLSINYYNQIENNAIGGKNYLPINIGINKELFRYSIDGNIKPYFYTEIGNIYTINQLNLYGVKLIDSSEEISFGIGLQFNKIKLNQYIFIGYTSSKKVDGKIILGFKMIWR